MSWMASFFGRTKTKMQPSFVDEVNTATTVAPSSRAAAGSYDDKWDPFFGPPVLRQRAPGGAPPAAVDAGPQPPVFVLRTSSVAADAAVPASTTPAPNNVVGTVVGTAAHPRSVNEHYSDADEDGPSGARTRLVS
jgi:hypothetical protein